MIPTQNYFCVCVCVVGVRGVQGGGAGGVCGGGGSRQHEVRGIFPVYR